MPDYQTHEHDVLVIGAGGAGLRAAIEASAEGVSVGVLAILAADVYAAFWFPDPATGRASFGIGLGTLVLAANIVLLGGYLFGCHSMRHVVGGCVDRLSSAPLGVRTYACVSCLNRRHMVWAWTSLCSVGFSDLYVRLCSMGVWSDVRIW